MPRTITSRAVRSYRTLSPLPVPFRRTAIGGLLSAALVVGFRPPDVIWHPALWSPDFPPPRQSPKGHQRGSGYLANSGDGLYRTWFTVTSENSYNIPIRLKIKQLRISLEG